MDVFSTRPLDSGSVLSGVEVATVVKPVAQGRFCSFLIKAHSSEDSESSMTIGGGWKGG